MKTFATKQLPDLPDATAPDGSNWRDRKKEKCVVRVGSVFASTMAWQWSWWVGQFR